jgi:hypothetical protein
MIQVADPDAAEPVACDGVAVVVTQPIPIGELGPLMQLRRASVEALDAAVFGADPEAALLILAQGHDEAAGGFHLEVQCD